MEISAIYRLAPNYKYWVYGLEVVVFESHEASTLNSFRALKFIIFF